MAHKFWQREMALRLPPHLDARNHPPYPQLTQQASLPQAEDPSTVTATHQPPRPLRPDAAICMRRQEPLSDSVSGAVHDAPINTPVTYTLTRNPTPDTLNPKRTPLHYLTKTNYFNTPVTDTLNPKPSLITC